ncbi:MAG: hypothetical protein ACYTAO_21950 [Planctomycetota bacterium]|jgi:hypothetical protein
MKTGHKIAIAVGLASLVLAGVAFAGWGGGGYRRGGGPGDRPSPGVPQNQAPWMGRRSGRRALDVPSGPQGRVRGARPRIEGPAARGGRGGNYTVCPRCGALCPVGGWGSGVGAGRGPGDLESVQDEARPPASAEEPEGVLVSRTNPLGRGGRVLDAETR